MTREAIIQKKILNRKLFDDDCSGDTFIQEKSCVPDEADMLFDNDLLSGKDLFDSEGILDEDYVCLDRFLASQMIFFFHE